MTWHGTQHSSRLADPILLSRCCCLQTTEFCALQWELRSSPAVTLVLAAQQTAVLTP